MRGVSGDDPEGGAGSGVPPVAARTAAAGGQGSLRQSLWLADKSLTAPVFHSRRRRRRSPAENRHGGAPREVPFATGQAAPQGSEVAPRTRDMTKECACRRSIHPSVRGGGADKVPKGRNNPDARMRRGNEKGHGERRNRRMEQVTRACPFAGRVGLFDIVDSVRAANGNIRLAIRHSPLWPDRTLSRRELAPTARVPGQCCRIFDRKVCARSL